MITSEINLLGLARVEDECKTQKRFIEFVIIPSWHWTRTRTYFLLPLYFKVCRNKQMYQKTCYEINTETVERWMWVNSLFLAPIRKPLFTLHLFDCCVSSVNKYRLGTSKCHDHDILTLYQPIRLQHFERGNENHISKGTIMFLLGFLINAMIKVVKSFLHVWQVEVWNLIWVQTW